MFDQDVLLRLAAEINSLLEGAIDAKTGKPKCDNKKQLRALQDVILKKLPVAHAFSARQQNSL